MRWVAMALAGLLAAPAWAECKEAPPADGSAARSLSDVPYEASTAQAAAPCPPAPRGGLEPSEGWTADTSQRRLSAARMGMFGTALGTLLLLSSANFAICAKHATDPANRDFCKGAAVPVLVAGLAATTLGIGTMAVATWVVPDEPQPGHASVSAGIRLRWAFDLPRR